MGIHVPRREVVVTLTSSFEYCLFADTTPIGIAISSDKKSAAS